VTQLTATERQYVDAYVNVCHAVWDVTKYVTAQLNRQVEALEAAIGDQARIDRLKDVAFEEAARR
jgi:hypothetical protein